MVPYGNFDFIAASKDEAQVALARHKVSNEIPSIFLDPLVALVSCSKDFEVGMSALIACSWNINYPTIGDSSFSCSIKTVANMQHPYYKQK